MSLTSQSMSLETNLPFSGGWEDLKLFSHVSFEQRMSRRDKTSRRWFWWWPLCLPKLCCVFLEQDCTVYFVQNRLSAFQGSSRQSIGKSCHESRRRHLQRRMKMRTHTCHVRRKRESSKREDDKWMTMKSFSWEVHVLFSTKTSSKGNAGHDFNKGCFNKGCDVWHHCIVTADKVDVLYEEADTRDQRKIIICRTWISPLTCMRVSWQS